jgi:hypothetical protein
MRMTRSVFCVVAFTVTSFGVLNAQEAPSQFVPFQVFVEATALASYGQYTTRPDSRVQDAAAFEEMRQHILALYQGVDVTHSFVLDSSHFDCIPIEQQPAIRILGLNNIAVSPPTATSVNASGDGSLAAEQPTNLTSQLAGENQFDQFGNSLVCEEGTIPMFRITLEQLTRFATLQQFLQKVPDESGLTLEPGQMFPPATEEHKYSYTYQGVNNHGGNSSLNLWSPHVNTSSGEVFSLSQQWYVGGSGTKLPGLQTAEVGWQNYPAFYGGENSRLFIYWTADGYNKTGCYNLTCVAFVQTNKSWTFGAGFTHYSTLGGTQYEFAAQFQLYKGNWWLFLGGTAVGYYPGSIYHGGQLTRYATAIEYGTEGVGTTVWPPEGSGQWSKKGWSYAAYQRNLFYINTSGTSVWDTLTPEQPSPKCYSISGPFWSSSSGWGIYFYEGGPGGKGC